jgi:PAS domain S-box-containing protein
MKQMTKRKKIISTSLLLGLLFVIFDAWLDSRFFYDGSFLDLLIFKVPLFEICLRTLFILILVICGLLLANFAEKVTAYRRKKVASEAELAKLIASTSAVSWKLDIASRKFTYVSAIIKQISGYPSQAWVDLDFWAGRIHPDDREFAVDFCLSAIAKGADHEFVYRMLTAGGGLIWIRQLAFVEKIADKPVYLGGFLFDITKIMETESENKELEAQLRQAQKMEALGQLAGGVAHDFNNFLCTIIGYGEMSLMTMADNDPHRANIREIIAAGNKAAAVTRSLLTFSRKQIMNPRPIRINEVVTGMGKLLARLLGENIILALKLPADPLTVKGDVSQLEQIIINMAANAKAAIRNNGAFTIELTKVTVEAKVLKNFGLTRAGEHACLSFTDNGVGMAAEILEKIFEPFYTTKEKDQGTGLGLAIVHGIVKQHNGAITAHSEKGCGTTFRVLLPCTESPVPTAAAQPEFLPRRGGAETILLAEDEETVRNLFSEILTSHGYKVILAIDGPDAIAKFTNHRQRIKLLILDAIMPGRNGGEVLANIRRISPGLKALFVSGYPPAAIEGTDPIPPDVDFLAKPISPTEFLHRVREILDRAT